VVVRTIPNASTTAIPVAAAEYDLLVPVLDQSVSDVSDLVPDNDIAVVLDDQVNYDRNQTALNWSRSGAAMKIVVTSLSGNQDANALRFAILLANYVDAETNGWSLGNASLSSVKYFDINGYEIAGPTPQVVVR
jgi:hypothetical protein